MRDLIVPKGWHLCVNQIPDIVSTINFKADIIFTEDCIYSLDKDDQDDWNKMPVGFSIGLSPHWLTMTKPMHYNSVRFGWRYNPLDETIEVTPYWYIKGVRHYAETDSLEIVKLKIGARYEFEINYVSNGTYSFSVDGKGWLIDTGIKHQEHPFGFSANLFFGGDRTAPHTIRMGYKRLSK